MLKKMPVGLEEINCKWAIQAPFFSEFLYRFNYYYIDGIKTIGVNCARGGINLYIDNNGWFDRLPIEQKEGVLIHEIEHLLTYTHLRNGTRLFKLFNIASDMCINSEINKMDIAGRRMKLPDCVNFIESIQKDYVKPDGTVLKGYDGRPISEEVYEYLFGKCKKIKLKMRKNSAGGSGSDGNQGQEQGEGEDGEQSKNGQPKNGKGQKNSKGNGQRQQGGNGQGDQIQEEIDGKGDEIEVTIYDPFDNHDSIMEGDDISAEILQEIINSARARGYGNISGGMQEFINEIITPKFNLEKFLHRKINQIAMERTSAVEDTWTRFNRRGLPLPGKRYLNGKLIIAVDTSGSIGEKHLSKFFGIIEKLCSTLNNVELIQFDCSVTEDAKYRKGDWKKIGVKGRGGTDPQCVFDKLREEKRTKNTVLFLTDGDFSYEFDIKGTKEIVWCVIDDVDKKIKIPHGVNVNLDLNDKN